ncbi:ABC transporter ATP-binding protein [Aeromicrobium sp. CTD01-1L150]|uniref:ABC transporter ATP-binding protein n=1 Tax=Aeromicrobium sp. CTD01-1L150 TaxID=3341830 RepID=UPI0035C20A92
MGSEELVWGLDHQEVDPALVVEDLTVSAATERGRFEVVREASLRLNRGKITGLAGESGSGKTVTALSVMGLLDRRTLRVERGTARLGDTDLLSMRGKRLRSTLGDRISMIFQEPMTSLDPMMPVGASISEVIRAHTQLGRRKARRRAIELLERVGLPNPVASSSSYPFEMSGGMLQRVLIAMAISCGPEVLIADEPTTALDVTVQAQIMRLLRELADDGMAVLIVTHDMGLIAEYADDLAVMYAGQVVEAGGTNELIESPRHPYTAGLLASVPSTRRRTSRLNAIAGRVPLLHEMPSGCRFAPRCPFAEECCAVSVPLVTVGDMRVARCVRVRELELDGVK